MKADNLEDRLTDIDAHIDSSTLIRQKHAYVKLLTHKLILFQRTYAFNHRMIGFYQLLQLQLLSNASLSSHVLPSQLSASTKECGQAPAVILCPGSLSSGHQRSRDPSWPPEISILSSRMFIWNLQPTDVHSLVSRGQLSASTAWRSWPLGRPGGVNDPSEQSA